jgi:hypothetical protein
VRWFEIEETVNIVQPLECGDLSPLSFSKRLALNFDICTTASMFVASVTLIRRLMPCVQQELPMNVFAA